MRIFARCLAAFVAALALAGCRDVQSALSPRGEEADRVFVLTWVLFVGAAVIFIAVMVLTAVALSRRGRLRELLRQEQIVLWGGFVFPLITLSALLAYGLLVMRAGAAAADARDPLKVHIAGELWWWRVTYTDDGGRQIESANELRIPVGRVVEIELSTNNVIHSFWVPNLAGKLDMIPGRTNVLRLTATAPGVSRGQCAEYCGGAHALMSFYVIAMQPSDFAAWLEREAAPAAEPDTALRQQGRHLFLASGCGACHAVLGTPARGVVGPDLTHVASRRSLAAATLPMDEPSLVRWISNSHAIKPQNLMPPYHIFDDASLAALAAYLSSLR